MSVCTFSCLSVGITADRVGSLRLNTPAGHESFFKSPTTTSPGVPLVTRRVPRVPPPPGSRVFFQQRSTTSGVLPPPATGARALSTKKKKMYHYNVCALKFLG